MTASADTWQIEDLEPNTSQLVWTPITWIGNAYSMHGDRALATVKILENSVLRSTIVFIYITVHKYTQYLLLVGFKKIK